MPGTGGFPGADEDRHKFLLGELNGCSPHCWHCYLALRRIPAEVILHCRASPPLPASLGITLISQCATQPSDHHWRDLTVLLKEAASTGPCAWCALSPRRPGSARRPRGRLLLALPGYHSRLLRGAGGSDADKLLPVARDAGLSRRPGRRTRRRAGGRSAASTGVGLCRPGRGRYHPRSRDDGSRPAAIIAAAGFGVRALSGSWAGADHSTGFRSAGHRRTELNLCLA